MVREDSGKDISVPHKRVLWRGRTVFVADPGSDIAEVLERFAAENPGQVRTLTEEEMRELAEAPELAPAPVPVQWTKAEAKAGVKSLRQIRQEQDLSLQALSRKSGAAYRTLSTVERGERIPSWRTIRKISEALGVHPDEVKEFAEVRQAEAARMGLEEPLPFVAAGS